jgi:hypothetical protein
MFELNNVPEKILDWMLEGISIPDGVEKLRRYGKIKIIKENYDDEEIEDMAAEYLYSGYGPIEILKIIPHNKVSISVDSLEQEIEKTFGLNHFTDGIKFSLDVDDCKKTTEKPYLELNVTKIRKMKMSAERQRKLETTQKEKEDNKFLIQLSVFDKYIIVVDNYELREIRKMKIINTVLDARAMVLQLRTDQTTADYCMHFFRKLFKTYSFRKFYFDKELIDCIKEEKKGLDGKTYEYIGLKQEELDRSSIIEKKTLKKLRNISDALQSSYDFPDETTGKKFKLESDFFNFVYGEDRDKDKEKEKNKERLKLQLTIGHSRLYFRKFASESIIDYVLDKFPSCHPRTLKLCALVIGHLKDEVAVDKKTKAKEFRLNKNLAMWIEKNVKRTEVRLVCRKHNGLHPDDIDPIMPDFIVGLHCNFSDEKVPGTNTKVLYCHDSENSERIAKILFKRLVEYPALRKKKIELEKHGEKGLRVLCAAKAPTVIVEPFFMSTGEGLEWEKKDADGLAEVYTKAVDEISGLMS